MKPARTVLGVVAVAAAVWTVALFAGYGQSLSLGGLRISSRNPIRPFVACLAAVAAYAWLGGAAGLRRDAVRARTITRGAAGAAGRAVETVEARLDARFVAVPIAIVSVAVSLWFRESTAGGADAYSYVTQADAWVNRTPQLRIDIPIAADVPWPDGIGTFLPFGYRPTVDGRGVVPVTAPGLPLMMAAFKLAAGHCAMFWVVPLTGGLLILATFWIGRRIAGGGVGLGAAWLVATSPTFLFLSRWVMSDVAAAAFWALALALVLRPSTAGAAFAGLSASAAILVRPNLLPIAAVIGAWLAWRELRAGRERRLSRVVAFAAALVPGCAIVAAVNRWLYGAPTASGYGDLNNLFSASHVAVNIGRYAGWLVDTQTLLALAGMATLLVPSRRSWPTAASRAAARLLGFVTLAVFAIYSAYTPFTDWWYLRFLLPAWPAIFVGTAALILGLSRGRRPLWRGLAAVAVGWLGVHGLMTAKDLGVYPQGEGERRYATVAELVARVTEPSAVIVTTAHVGAMRYYGGRLTVRFDTLDPAWLDRALDWFARNGRRPYILLEEQEVPEFRARFRGAAAAARLEMAPILDYEAHLIRGRVYLFDPRASEPRTWRPAPIQDPQPRCPLPAPAPPLYSTR